MEVLIRIADRHNHVNLHWLLTGRGEMILDEMSDETSKVNEGQIIQEKERLEELEEGVAQLEEMISRLVKDSKK